MSPSFGPRQMQTYNAIFWAKAMKLLEVLHLQQTELSSCQPGSSFVVEIKNWSKRVSLDIIGEAGMGQPFEAIQKPDSQIASWYNSAVKGPPATPGGYVTRAMELLLPFSLLRMVGMPHPNSVHCASQNIKARCREAIEKEKAELSSGKATPSVNIMSTMLHALHPTAIDTGALVD